MQQFFDVGQMGTLAQTWQSQASEVQQSGQYQAGIFRALALRCPQQVWTVITAAEGH